MIENKEKNEFTINNKKIKYSMVEIDQKDLFYYIENPRIYSEWPAEEIHDIEQVEIENKLQKMDHVKQLMQSIESNGGITDPLIVREGDNVVFDGNSRLAAIRKLAFSNPIKWAKVTCKVLDKEIDENAIFTLLGHLHIIGRKDWQPFEQAGYLFRRNKNDGVSIDNMAKELGMGKKLIRSMIDTYSFMIEKNDLEATKWSYYYELLINRGFKNISKEIPDFEGFLVEDIKNGRIDKAEDIRKLTTIWKVKPRQRQKLLEQYIQGRNNFNQMYDDALATTAGNDYCLKFEKFRELTADTSDIMSEFEKMNSDQQQNFKYNVKRIIKNLQALKTEK